MRSHSYDYSCGCQLCRKTQTVIVLQLVDVGAVGVRPPIERGSWRPAPARCWPAQRKRCHSAFSQTG